MPIPNPDTTNPIEGIERTVFLKNIVDDPSIEIGDYTYYEDPEGPESFLKNVLYNFPFINDRLIVGKFCQIAIGVTFVMNGANHRTRGLSTYPFAAFGGDWAGHFDGELDGEFKGDLVVGNDVWLGYQALLMPGVKIGNGSIIGARSVVVDDVPPYAVVAGNPAKVRKKRFDDRTIEALLRIAWWDWPPSLITEAIAEIGNGDIEALERRARNR